jgi:hypothetical protein
MSTSILAIGLALVIVAVASAYAHASQSRQRKTAADTHRIANAVAEYFVRSGAQVSAQCHATQGRFLVLVESEPLKRFRYSHIVEAALVSHVEKALGLHVDRVFWRFPLPVGSVCAQDTADLKPAGREDEYVAQGVRAAKSNPEYHVAEDSWDQFEKAQQGDGVSTAAPAPVGEGREMANH